MEVNLTPELQTKLDRLARDSGRSVVELVEDALAGYLDEVAATRATLDSRYDDLKLGHVKPIDGEEAFVRLQHRTDAHRRRPASADMRFTRKPTRISTKSETT